MTSAAGLTGRGWALLGAGVAWCAGAWLAGQRDLWWPGLFLVFLPLLSWLVLLPATTLPRVRRVVEPNRVSVAEPIEVRLTLAPGPRSLGGVTRVRDRVPGRLGGVDWLAAPSAPGGRERELSYRLRPAHRGRYRIGPLERSVDDGLGLARAAQVIPECSELLVTPRVEPLAELRASGVGVAPDTSVLRTGHGSADDALIREYHQGDDLRRIHWRSTARTGQLMVRREERSRNPIATVLVDNRSRGYGFDAGERFEWVVSAAASLAVHLLADGFDVTVVFADGVLISPPRSGPGRVDAILERLAELDTVPTRHLDEAMAACVGGPDGQLLVAILARVDPEDAAALNASTRPGRARWALLAHDAGGDLTGLDTLRAAGWRCGSAGAGVAVADAWRELAHRELR